MSGQHWILIVMADEFDEPSGQRVTRVGPFTSDDEAYEWLEANWAAVNFHVDAFTSAGWTTGVVAFTSDGADTLPQEFLAEVTEMQADPQWASQVMRFRAADSWLASARKSAEEMNLSTERARDRRLDDD